ncbi:MAG: hypothetical protein NTV65_11425, partial [Proteobacteria bacterium]|nr:hypothetical protein [Pseudomonadota bacterium]
MPQINGSAMIIRELESGPAVGARVVEHRPVGALRVRATERLAILTSAAPTASAHSACATAAYSIYITATSHALAALHRAAPATYSIYITATSLALA